MDLKWLLFSLEGRINRKVYWMTFLCMIPIYIVAMILDGLLFEPTAMGFGPLYLITMLVLLWPGIALSVKRLHDRNRSGLFYFLFFVPLVNLWMVVEVGFLKGTQGTNNFGPDPLGGATDAGQYTAPSQV